MHGSVPAGNVREFLAYARARPGQLNHGSPGTGTGHHLYMELLKLMTGIDIRHVPYKGAAPALNDLLGGQIQAMLAPVHQALGVAKDGKVCVLGGSMRERSPLFPDLPTIHEQGVTGFGTESWYALVGPAGMPPNIVAKYSGIGTRRCDFWKGTSVR